MQHVCGGASSKVQQRKEQGEAMPQDDVLLSADQGILTRTHNKRASQLARRYRVPLLILLTLFGWYIATSSGMNMGSREPRP